MKYRPLSNFLLLGILPFLLIYCSVPKELEYRDFKNFAISKVGFSATSIRLDLVYYNPNGFGLQLQRTDLDIFLDDTYLGHTVQEQQITIPRQSEFAIPVSIDVDMKNLLKNSFLSLLSTEVTVKVRGSVKVGKGNVYKNFPVSYEGKQRLNSF
jgi:LEA14-like dessication related protein